MPIIIFTVLSWNTEFSLSPFWKLSMEIFLSKFSFLFKTLKWKKEIKEYLKNGAMSEASKKKTDNIKFFEKQTSLCFYRPTCKCQHLCPAAGNMVSNKL